MENTKTSVFSNGMIWFGAAVSIAEILTGTLIAPLGITKGLAAILLGHFIGCILFFFAGLIGAKTEKSAMETVKISFGSKGSLLFSTLNVLQLLGWTAVMIVSGAAAAESVTNFGGTFIWSILIGALILFWVLIGFKNMSKINIAAMGVLFILTIVLSTIVFRGNSSAVFENGLSFGAAVELSAAMPLSWLPLISDYTRHAKKPKKTTLISSLVYFVTSCWMYSIGLSAALFTGESDISKIMINAGFGVSALIIIIFSTVTTTFLDVYSAGVSSESINKKLKVKPVAVVICILGTVLAVFTPITQYENFLYLIGSVFSPMIAILIVDYFILHKDYTEKNVNWLNLVLWAIGFIIYRIFMYVDTPIGNTAPVMVITAALCLFINYFVKRPAKGNEI
jgi:putative hydroxymethylpyrimidine transporter CytX